MYFPAFIAISIGFFWKCLSLRLEGKETLNTVASVCPHLEKFNIVSNDHGHTQKYDFCILVCKTNFTDQHQPNTIHGFRDSILGCKMHDCYVMQKF